MESLTLSSPTTPFSHRFLSRRSIFQSPPSASLSLPRRSTNALRSSSSSSSSSTPFSSSSSPLFFFPSKPKQPSLSNPKPKPSAIRTSSSPTSQNPNLQGAKLVPLTISVAVGLILRFFVPRPVEVSPQAWQLLAIFLSTIAGLVLSPLPVGAWAFLGLTTSVVTRTIPFATAFGAFTNEVIWLIVISFFFARGFVKTGLGDRIATYFVKWLGKSTLGLSYGLTISEAIIAPAMPSTTARAGGVFLPIIKSLSLSAGSRPGDPSAKRLGSYLVQSQFQVRFCT